MALNSSKLTAIATPGVAATPARPGRFASASTSAVEGSPFTPQVGLNDSSRLGGGYEEWRSGFSQDQGSQRDQGTPFVFRSASSFSVEDAEAVSESAGPSHQEFLSLLNRGVSSYENTTRRTSPSTVKPGSVLNYFF